MSFTYIKDKLKENGVTVENTAKGSAIFMGISFVWVGILLGFCYTFSPTKAFLSRIPSKYVQKAYEKKSLLEHSPLFRRVPERLRGKVAYTFCEMIMVKSLVAPVSLPLKIWLTIKLLTIS